MWTSGVPLIAMPVDWTNSLFTYSDYERRKKTNYYESDHSSDEDIPLVDVRKRRQPDTRRDSSPSSDEDWTPNRSKGKKKHKGRGSYRGTFSDQIVWERYVMTLYAVICAKNLLF